MPEFGNVKALTFDLFGTVLDLAGSLTPAIDEFLRRKNSAADPRRFWEQWRYRQRIEQYQDIIREYVRKRHGVYALYRRGKLHYVGLASNLRVRLKQHLHDRYKDSWDRFSIYLTIDNRAI